MAVRVTRVIAKLEPGGSQLAALSLVLGLRAQGIESRVLAGYATAAGVALFEAAGIAVETMGSRRDLQYATSEPFARWLAPRLIDADVVHGQMFGAWWATGQAIGETTPLVGSEHNAVRWPGRPRLEEMREALRRVDLFFATGPETRQLVLSLGLPARRLRPGGGAVTGGRARPRSSLPTPRVVYAGRLHEEKGPDLLVEAMTRIDAPMEAFLLGAGPLEDELRERVAALGLEDRVHLPGWQDDPASWIAGATACVVPSRRDARPLAALLAMDLGVPVIGTAVEGIPEMLAHSRGVLVTPEDPRAIAAAIESVADGGARPDLAAARRYARRYTPARVTARYARAYRTLAGARA